MAFALSSGTAVSAAPFCLGFAFKKGDVPAGQGVVGSIANLQVVPKNRWPDGSLKFAVVAGRADLAAGQALTVTLAPGASTGGTALALADLKATGVTASVGCGSFGSVAWATTDWDAPFQSWVSGPQMSSWVYRKAVGTDAHLVAWLEVRLYAGGAVEVLPWIENGYLLVAGPTNKSATFTFTLGATQRVSAAIDLPHHCRTPLVSGTALSSWLGPDPQVTPRHDVRYLQASELVPSYRVALTTSAGTDALATTAYTPLQQSNFTYDTDSMPSPGYQQPIGLLPAHDVMYLACSEAAGFGSVVRNGFSAGRYPIHYRDETTNRPLRFSSYPNLVISDGSGYYGNGSSSTGTVTPTVSGTAPPTWDPAHSPSVGFMAYLVTGFWYFMEECQFAATTNYLGMTDTTAMRTGSDGILHPVYGGWQTRASAWGIRALCQALCVTPDNDTALQGEFVSSFQRNVEFHHSRYIAQANNPFGFIEPAENYGNQQGTGAAWQQDFVTAAWGYARALSLPISSTHTSKLAAFFDWKARSIIGRVGPMGQFWYINADPYVMRFAPVDLPDFIGGTGPWYSDWTGIYAATYASPPAWLGSTDSVLAGEYFGEAVKGLWGNLQPALAYAVRFSVPGASDAYNRMVGASNWQTVETQFNTWPVWSVRPSAAS